MRSHHEGPRILVLGAGAIGGVTAAQLTRAGEDVTVLDADEEHVRALNGRGLLLDEFGTESLIRIPAVSHAEQLDGQFDYCLITVKSLYLDAALPPLVAKRSATTYVSLGNGLVQERVRTLVGDANLLLGIVEWGATNLSPGHVRQTTKAPFVIGEPDGQPSQRAELLAQVLRRAAAGTRTTTDIAGQIWSKLLVNSTFSGLGAVSGLLYGGVVADSVGREVALRLWAEGACVARALGIGLADVLGIHPAELTAPDPDPALERLMETVAATKASMLQDLERGSLTEVDVINGGVVETANRLGLDARLNKAIVSLVHGYEAGVGRPSPEVFTALASVPVSPAERRPEENSHA
ncbi:ketopantoate reductase family protein [Kribbella sp. NPDC050124]|uniref:ketopantoate reductase family protein n=1 Tax=Kribbella sp. NPDC050124 TaxID=3364114 RepID=UPI0037AEC1FD